MPAPAPKATSVSMLGESLKRREKPTVKYLRLKIKMGTVSTSCANA